MKKLTKKQRHQVKSRWYYVFWGAATISVFAGQLYVGSGYRSAKVQHPDIPFYLQDERGQTFEFGWSLIYQYISNISYYPDW